MIIINCLNPYDWKIHKKLDEARTIYYVPARGQGQTYIRDIEQLIRENKRIVIVRPTKPRTKLLGERPDHCLYDKDILTPERYD